MTDLEKRLAKIKPHDIVQLRVYPSLKEPGKWVVDSLSGKTEGSRFKGTLIVWPEEK